MKSVEWKRVWPQTYAEFAREACRGTSWVLLKLTGSIVIDNECWTAFRTLCGQLNGFDISFCYCSAASNGTAFRGAPGATGRVIYLRLVRFVPAQQRCCYGGRSLCLNQTVRSCTNFSSGQGSGRTCVPTLFVAMFLFLHLWIDIGKKCSLPQGWEHSMSW